MEVKSTLQTQDIGKITTSGPRTEAKGAAPASPARASDDAVKLTDNARQMQDLQGAVAATPVVDRDRVAALREAIANGTYTIDPQRIADGLLAQDRSALG